jgi:hypothetical protein
MHLESCTGVTISRRNRKGATVSLLPAVIAGSARTAGAVDQLPSEVIRQGTGRHGV